MFTKLSIAFVVPGGSAARLGLPDVLFFAVFLGASVRWGLRPLWTWLVMTIGLGITIALTTFWSNERPARATGDRPRLPAPERATCIWRRLFSENAWKPEQESL